MNSRKSVVSYLRPFAGSTTLKLYYLLAQFATVSLFARILGAERFGQYALAMAIIQVIAVIAQFGFQTLIVRRAAIAQSQEDDEFRAVFSTAMVNIAAVSLLAVAALLLLSAFVDIGLLATAMWATLLIPVLALLALFSATLRGFGEVNRAQLAEMAVRPTLILAIAGLVIMLGQELDPLAVLMAQIVGSSCAAFFAIWLLFHRTNVSSPRLPQMGEWKRYSRESLPYLILSGSQILNYQLGVLLTGSFLSDAEVGQLRVAVQIGDALVVFMLAISAVLAPRIAALHAAKDWAALSHEIVWGHRLVLLIMLPIVAILWLLADPIIFLLFGEGYAPAVGPMRIFLAMQLLMAPVCMTGVIANMIGRPAITLGATVGGMIILLILGLVLIPNLGIEGAALASLIAIVTSTYAMLWLLRREVASTMAAFERIGVREVG